MIDEELADEELADEYVRNNIHYEVGVREDGTNYAKEISSVTIKEAFLAGLKAGRTVWHNLMKDQHDLPNDDRFVLNETGVRVFYLPSRHKWYYVSPVKPVISEIVAWCEIPKYTEE